MADFTCSHATIISETMKQDCKGWRLWGACIFFSFLSTTSGLNYLSHLHDSIVAFVSMHVIAGCLTAYQLV